MDLINDKGYKKIVKENIFDMLIYLFNEEKVFDIYIIKKYILPEMVENVDNEVFPISIGKKEGSAILDENYLYLKIKIIYNDNDNYKDNKDENEELDIKIPLLSIYQILDENKEPILMNFVSTKNLNLINEEDEEEKIKLLKKSLKVITSDENKDFFK